MYFAHKPAWKRPSPVGDLRPPTRHPSPAPFRGTPPPGGYMDNKTGSQGWMEITPPSKRNVPMPPAQRAGLERAARMAGEAGRAGRAARALLRKLGLFGVVLEGAEMIFGGLAQDWLYGFESDAPTGYTLRCAMPAGCTGSLSTDLWGHAASFNAGVMCIQCNNWPLAYTKTQIETSIGYRPKVLAHGRKRAAFIDNVREVWERDSASSTGNVTFLRYVIPFTTPLFQPVPDPAPGPATQYAPRRWPRVRYKPYQEPATQWQIGGRGPTKTPVKHDNLPPGPGVKERKRSIPLNTKLHRVYGALTELMDMVDCMAKAIPGEPCKNARTVQAKIACIYRNYGRMNFPEFNACMQSNDSKDFLVGKYNKMAQDQLRRHGNAGNYAGGTGFGAGTWAWR